MYYVLPPTQSIVILLTVQLPPVLQKSDPVLKNSTIFIKSHPTLYMKMMHETLETGTSLTVSNT